MSFAYVCRADDYAKSGVLNKMCKTVDLVGGATANAGLYSAHPTIRCPYCYAKDTSIATEGQRLKGALRGELRTALGPHRTGGVAGTQQQQRHRKEQEQAGGEGLHRLASYP